MKSRRPRAMRALDEFFVFRAFSKTVAERLCANFLQTATKLNL
jgi:hypothetical protein